MDYSQKRMFEKNGARVLNQMDVNQYYNLPNHNQYEPNLAGPDMYQMAPIDGLMREVDYPANRNPINYMDELNALYNDGLGMNFAIRTPAYMQQRPDGPYSNLLPMTAHLKNAYRPPEPMNRNLLDEEFKKVQRQPAFMKLDNELGRKSINNLSEVESLKSHVSYVEKPRVNKEQHPPRVETSPNQQNPNPVPDMNLLLTLKLLDPNFKIVGLEGRHVEGDLPL